MDSDGEESCAECCVSPWEGTALGGLARATSAGMHGGRASETMKMLLALDQATELNVLHMFCFTELAKKLFMLKTLYVLDTSYDTNNVISWIHKHLANLRGDEVTGPDAHTVLAYCATTPLFEWRMIPASFIQIHWKGLACRIDAKGQMCGEYLSGTKRGLTCLEYLLTEEDESEELRQLMGQLECNEVSVHNAPLMMQMIRWRKWEDPAYMRIASARHGDLRRTESMLLARHATPDVQRAWLSSWTAEQCMPAMQDRNGWTVSTILARYAAPVVQLAWLASWTAEQCMPALVDEDGWILSMFLARYATPDVQLAWLSSWTADQCIPAIQNKSGWTVAMILARYAEQEVQLAWLSSWTVDQCMPALQNKNGCTVSMMLARHVDKEVHLVWLSSWTADQCMPSLQYKNGCTMSMILARYAEQEVQLAWLSSWSVEQCMPDVRNNNGYTVTDLINDHAGTEVQTVWASMMDARL